MKYAICNELFGNLPLDEAASITASHGYHGLELAPFTIFGDFSSAMVSRGIAEAKRALNGNGLAFAGFHWLMVRPEGLHITTPDKALRKKSWDHLRRLIDAAAELGGGNLILGSPRQRGSLPGQTTREQAAGFLAEGLAEIAPFAAERKSALLLEVLSSDQTDVINYMADAAAIIDRIGNPGVGGMLDFHNCADETDSYETLVEKYFRIIRHVHLNDAAGNHPRAGDFSYLPAFSRLRRLGYGQWVSLEIFTMPDDPAAVLRETMEYLREIEASMAAGMQNS